MATLHEQLVRAITHHDWDTANKIFLQIVEQKMRVYTDPSLQKKK